MTRLGTALVLLGLGVAVTALLGPLAFGVIEYHVVDEVRHQVVGGDAVGLVLVAPVSVLAGVLARRGHTAGPALALGTAGYATYTYAQLALGGEFAVQPGNSERFFPLFLTLAVLGGACLVLAWTQLRDRPLPALSPHMRTVVVAVVAGIAVFLTLGLHLPGLVDVVGGPPYDVAYTQGPTVFWVVKLMDLGLVVPLAAVTAMGLRRDAAWSRRLAYGMVAWGALLGSAVAGMGVVQVLTDDPAASLAGVGVFVLFALAFLGLAVRLFRPLVAAPTGTTAERTPTLV